MMRSRCLTLVLLLALAAAPLGAESWTIDPMRSRVGFEIRHILSTVEGRFSEFEGSFDWSPEAPEAARLEVTIQSASIDTDHSDRDQHLRSEDFFDCGQFPTLVYSASGAQPLADGRLRVDGELSMHGVTRSLSLEVTPGKRMTDPHGRSVQRFDASGRLDRQDYGLSWNKLLDTGSVVLGDEVEIVLRVVAVSAPGPAATD